MVGRALMELGLRMGTRVLTVAVLLAGRVLTGTLRERGVLMELGWLRHMEVGILAERTSCLGAGNCVHGTTRGSKA